jgi:glycosyltransferase involved in cell wall biosynthesis
VRLLVLNYEYPPLGGGAGNATYFLCREWGKAGHTIDIVTTWFTGLEEKTRESDNVTVYRIRSKRSRKDRSNPLEMMSYVRCGLTKARQLVGSHSYDAAISFFAIPTGVIAYRLFRKYSIPYVVLLRGGDVPGFLRSELGLFHALTMPLWRPVWRNARRIIANSKSLQLLAEKTAHGLGCTVDMVPNGVDADFFRPAPDQAAHKDHFTFIFSGRFVPQKNLFCLLDQFESIATHPFVPSLEREGKIPIGHVTPAGTGLRLILVGDGPEKAGLEKRIKSSPVLSKSVMLYPWSSKEELRGLYQTAHCFVNPSFEEGMPNTLLEAMACGLAVIASDIGGNNELVENNKNGLLFDVDKPVALGKCMQEIMRKSDIRDMGACSRSLVSLHFSWKQTAAQILDKV